MTLHTLFASAGGILTAVALAWNIVAILRGKVLPTFTSWAIWAALDIILAASMYAKGALNPQMAVAAVGASVVFLLACFYGKPGWTRIDQYSLLGGFLAIVLWLVTGNATVANIISLIAIIIGCFPTYASMIEDPSREDKTFWCLAFTSSVCALIGTSEMSVDALAPPTVFVLAQAVSLYLMFFPQSVTSRVER